MNDALGSSRYEINEVEPIYLTVGRHETRGEVLRHFIDLRGVSLLKILVLPARLFVNRRDDLTA
jgi:asparagine N-glycosylation enzyme membrane subunit Stt3